jgi:O-antigen ligase
MFLDYGIQMGVPGILAFAFLFACVIREFLRLYRSSNLNVALIGVAGMAIVAAVILKSATDDQFIRHNALLFWALVGMGLGYGTRLAQAAESERMPDGARPA